LVVEFMIVVLVFDTRFEQWWLFLLLLMLIYCKRFFVSKAGKRGPSGKQNSKCREGGPVLYGKIQKFRNSLWDS